MVWLHTLWSHRYTQWTLAREHPPSNGTIVGINLTVLLLRNLGKLLRENDTVEGCDQVTPWVSSPGLFFASFSHQHETDCLKRLLDKQVVFGNC